MFKKSKLFALCCCLTLGLCADEFVILTKTDSPGWVFRPGEKIRAALRSGAALQNAPVIEWRDYYGNTKQLKTTISQEKNEAGFQLPTEDNGYFTLKSGGTSCSYAVIKAAPEHDAFTNPFGVNFHLNRTPLNEAKRELAYAKYLGYGWTRGAMNDWGDFGSDNFDHELKRFEGIHEAVKNSGLCVLSGIYSIPLYASGCPEETYLVYSRTPTESMKEVGTYAEYVSKRFPWVTYWEIFNEPDAQVFWCGRRSSIGNKEKMFRDYVDFLVISSKAIRKGNPNAKILYAGICGGGDVDGDTRRFIEITMANNSRKYCDIMNLHYSGSISSFRSIMKKYNQPDAPFWVTETGSTAGGPVYDETRQLRADLLQVIEQLTNGAEKTFKYDFRNDGMNPAEPEDNFGMVTRDFHPKPNAVANATMIRLLVDANNAKRLNITRNCNAGYLKGFEFDDGKGGKINFIILEAAKSARVTLKTPDAKLLLTDAMGKEKILTAKDGQISFELTELPVFLTGKIIPKKGEVVYPEEKLLRRIQGKFPNPGFDKDIAGWGNGIDKNVVKFSHHTENGNGFMRIEVSAPGPKGFYGVSTTMQDDVRKIFKSLKKEEFLKVRFKVRLRYSNVLGRGIVPVANLFKPGESERFDRCEMGYENGTSKGWKDIEVCQQISDQTGRIDFFFCFAPGTTGTVDLDNVSIVLEVWRKAL